MVEVPPHRETHREVRRLAEQFGEAQCRVGGDGAASVDDLIEAPERHVQPAGGLALGEPGIGKKSSRSASPGCVGGRSVGMRTINSSKESVARRSSVIIYNLYGSRPALGPDETDPVLVVDANAVLPASVPTQCFEPTATRLPQVRNRAGRVQVVEFAARNTTQLLWTAGPRCPRRTAGEQVLGTAIAEGLDHRASVGMDTSRLLQYNAYRANLLDEARDHGFARLTSKVSDRPHTDVTERH